MLFSHPLPHYHQTQAMISGSLQWPQSHWLIQQSSLLRRESQSSIYCLSPSSDFRYTVNQSCVCIRQPRGGLGFPDLSLSSLALRTGSLPKPEICQFPLNWWSASPSNPSIHPISQTHTDLSNFVHECWRLNSISRAWHSKCFYLLSSSLCDILSSATFPCPLRLPHPRNTLFVRVYNKFPPLQTFLELLPNSTLMPRVLYLLVSACIMELTLRCCLWFWNYTQKKTRNK